MVNNICLSIVIVNYNTKSYTAQCLDSIYQDPPRSKFETILVDNASSDDSAEWLKSRYPQVLLVKSERNNGIAGGNNLGIRASRGRYVLLLNNDTLVKPGALDLTVQFLEAHPEAAGVGGNLINADGSFQSGYISFPTLGQLFLITTKLGQLLHSFYPSHPRGDTIKEVDWMSTAFMTFRRDALLQAGLVDEQYFIYSDESDLQLRLKNAGWKIYYLPDLETIHFGSKSLSPWRRRRLVYRGYLLFFVKHRSRVEAGLLRMMFISACLLKIPFWWANTLIPSRQELADLELESNYSILRMCLKPGIEVS
jgi:N-acetylglucosaminyl-diphospho-decaprenol L-rhamnosyltransferase